MKRIAVLSYNHNKYSETFIGNMVKRLPGQIHFLYGGDLPMFYGNDVPFLKEDAKSKFAYALKEWATGKDWRTQHSEKVEQYLIENRIEAVVANYAITAFPVMEICRKHKIPLIVHFHGWTAYRQSLINSRLEEYGQMFEIASAVIGVSQDMIEQLKMLGADPAKLHLITYGADPEIFTYKDCSANENIFFSAGRFCDTKNPHLTILAFNKVLKSLPGAKLVMAGGDENLLNVCINLSQALGIGDKIDFCGVLTPSQIYERMSSSLAFVQHSATTIEGEKEGTPVAVIEACATGLPVIATRHAGIKDVVIDGETGLLCDEYDIEAMAGNMVTLANNRVLAKRLGAAASQRVLNNFTMKQYIDKLDAVIEAVVKK
ncbi:MAG: hypothetical protein JWO06_2790 [Bacteroidota bacterium]|nr:hypothetical protein [Bacteroidota bacterium]